MPYDPDLEPIFDGFNAQIAAIIARLDRLEGTQTAQPQPQPQPTAPIWTTLTRSRLSIPASVDVPAGQREIYIPVRADHTNRESFYCYVSGLTNVSGGNINVGDDTQQRANYDGLDVLYRWSPSDDLTHYIKLVTRQTYPAGRMLDVVIRVKGLGDSQKGGSTRIRFTADATQPAMPAQYHRPLRRLELTGATRKNTFNPATLVASDTGFLSNGTPTWRARLSHGYAQDGNGETGLYMNEEKFPGKAQSPITYDSAENALRLHTHAFPMQERAEHDNRLFRHQAAVIQGQTMDAVCGTSGVWRMEAKLPIRRYSWPAFWLVGRGPTGAAGSWTAWPPEIDILEKFNQAWGAADTPYTTTFAQHYGNAGSNVRAGSFGSEIEVNQWIPGTGRLNEGYHSWACCITYNSDPARSEVTFFFDDVEVGCHILHARHHDMLTRMELFPIANVAVKAPADYTPEQYNTDAGRGNSGDMWIKDIAYYPAGHSFTDIAPLPPRVLTPPRLSGSAITTQSLSINPGTWAGDGFRSYAYRWQVSDDGTTGWRELSGATGSVLALTAEQQGKFVRAQVQVTNDVGQSAWVSTPRVGPSAPISTPVLVSPSAVTGELKVGATLRVDPAPVYSSNIQPYVGITWRGRAQGSSTAVNLGTGNTLTLTQAHIGMTIYVSHYGSIGGLQSPTTTGPLLGPVAAA